MIPMGLCDRNCVILWTNRATFTTLEVPMGSNRPELSIFNLITSTLLALTCHNFCDIILPYVTGSGKRDIFAQTMIFQYKRCCSKKRNIIYYSKKFFLA